MRKHQGEAFSKGFTCWSQFSGMMFGQLSSQKGLRGTEAGLAINKNNFYHLGIKPVKRSTHAYANENRHHQIYQDLFYSLLGKLHGKKKHHKFKFKNPVYSIDAASFTTIRLVSGAVVLLLIASFLRRGKTGKGNWISAFALFAYAAGFSFAYISLTAATGALLLFSAVQAMMICHGLIAGERLHRQQLVGMMLTIGGLVGLLLPGLSSPPLIGSVLMFIGGVAWGVYSLRGKSNDDPTRVTAENFLRATVFTALLH